MDCPMVSGWSSAPSMNWAASAREIRKPPRTLCPYAAR